MNAELSELLSLILNDNFNLSILTMHSVWCLSCLTYIVCLDEIVASILMCR